MRAMSRRTGLALAAGVDRLRRAHDAGRHARAARRVEFLVARPRHRAHLRRCRPRRRLAATAIAGRPDAPGEWGLWYVGSYAPTGQPVVTHLGFAFEALLRPRARGPAALLSSPAQRLRAAPADRGPRGRHGRPFARPPRLPRPGPPLRLRRLPAQPVRALARPGGLRRPSRSRRTSRSRRCSPLVGRSSLSAGCCAPGLSCGACAGRSSSPAAWPWRAAAFDAFEYAWTTATGVAAARAGRTMGRGLPLVDVRGADARADRLPRRHASASRRARAARSVRGRPGAAERRRRVGRRASDRARRPIARPPATGRRRIAGRPRTARPPRCPSREPGRAVTLVGPDGPAAGGDRPRPGAARAARARSRRSSGSSASPSRTSASRRSCGSSSRRSPSRGSASSPRPRTSGGASSATSTTAPSSASSA